MSSENGGNSADIANAGDCECGYDPGNKRHNESYWEGRMDPRERDEKDFRFISHYYAAMDRQIAENHATRCLSKGNQGNGKN